MGGGGGGGVKTNLKARAVIKEQERESSRFVQYSFIALHVAQTSPATALIARSDKHSGAVPSQICTLDNAMPFQICTRHWIMQDTYANGETEKDRKYPLLHSTVPQPKEVRNKFQRGQHDFIFEDASRCGVDLDCVRSYSRY